MKQDKAVRPLCLIMVLNLMVNGPLHGLGR